MNQNNDFTKLGKELDVQRLEKVRAGDFKAGMDWRTQQQGYDYEKAHGLEPTKPAPPDLARVAIHHGVVPPERPPEIPTAPQEPTSQP